MSRAMGSGLVLALLFGIAGCAPANQNLPPESTRAAVGNDGAEIQVTADGVRSYVVRGDYRRWVSDATVHPRTQNSPHGMVRVFFNTLGIEALRAGAQQLPSGAMLVKELYKDDGVTLDGYSAMVKYVAGSS